MFKDKDETIISRMMKEKDFAKSMLDELKAAQSRISELEEILVLREEEQLRLIEESQDNDRMTKLLESNVKLAVDKLDKLSRRESDTIAVSDVLVAINGLKTYVAFYMDQDDE